MKANLWHLCCHAVLFGMLTTMGIIDCIDHHPWTALAMFIISGANGIGMVVKFRTVSYSIAAIEVLRRDL